MGDGILESLKKNSVVRYVVSSSIDWSCVFTRPPWEKSWIRHCVGVCVCGCGVVWVVVSVVFREKQARREGAQNIHPFQFPSACRRARFLSGHAPGWDTSECARHTFLFDTFGKSCDRSYAGRRVLRVLAYSLFIVIIACCDAAYDRRTEFSPHLYVSFPSAALKTGVAAHLIHTSSVIVIQGQHYRDKARSQQVSKYVISRKIARRSGLSQTLNTKQIQRIQVVEQRPWLWSSVPYGCDRRFYCVISAHMSAPMSVWVALSALVFADNARHDDTTRRQDERGMWEVSKGAKWVGFGWAVTKGFQD